MRWVAAALLWLVSAFAARAGESSIEKHLLFLDDLGTPGFEMVGEDLPPGIHWRGFQLATLEASEDGRYVVMGDEEALSQLMVFPVK